MDLTTAEQGGLAVLSAAEGGADLALCAVHRTEVRQASEALRALFLQQKAAKVGSVDSGAAPLLPRLPLGIGRRSRGDA